MCEKAFEMANEAVEGVKFLACKEPHCVMYVASTPVKAKARMDLIREKFPRAHVVEVLEMHYIYTSVHLGTDVYEQTFFKNEIGRVTVKMENGSPNKVAYCYIGDKCAFIHYSDIPQIVEALVTKDWSAMDGLETKSAIMHDLYDADIITHEVYRDC